jgi:hypothetical protein
MKNFSAFLAFILIIVTWNYFPYSYFCLDYPLTGCDASSFWWNLPKEAYQYKGIRWGSYFITNFILTLIILFVFNGLNSKKEQ